MVGNCLENQTKKKTRAKERGRVTGNKKNIVQRRKAGNTLQKKGRGGELANRHTARKKIAPQMSKTETSHKGFVRRNTVGVKNNLGQAPVACLETRNPGNFGDRHVSRNHGDGCRKKRGKKKEGPRCW